MEGGGCGTESLILPCEYGTGVVGLVFKRLLQGQHQQMYYKTRSYTYQIDKVTQVNISILWIKPRLSDTNITTYE